MNHIQDVLAVNVDERPKDAIAKYREQLGWTVLTHKYGGAEGKADWDS